MRSILCGGLLAVLTVCPTFATAAPRQVVVRQAACATAVCNKAVVANQVVAAQVVQPVLLPAYQYPYSFASEVASKDIQANTKAVADLTKLVSALAQSVQAMQGGQVSGCGNAACTCGCQSGAACTCNPAPNPTPQKLDGASILQGKCISCHSGPQPAGKPQLADAAGNLVALDEATKRAVFASAKFGVMPPADKGKQPLSDEEFAALNSYLYPEKAQEAPAPAK